MLTQVFFAHASQKVESIDRFSVKDVVCRKHNEQIFMYLYAISQLNKHTGIKGKNISLAGELSEYLHSP